MAQKQPPAISIKFHPDAVADFKTLAPALLADVVAKVNRLDGKTQPEIVQMLDRRTEPKVFQWESSAQGGTLRVIFAWGKGCLWMIGAFVKVNDKEGERFMKRILPRATQVKDWDINK